MKKNNYGFYLEKEEITPSGYDYCYSINQNLTSLSLYLKGIFYNNAMLLFFISIFNLFQSLEEYTSENNICYVSYSQALTTYFLKYCERLGIVKIISCEQDGEMSFAPYYWELNNEPKKYFHKAYDVTFIKIRSFTQDDIKQIKSILRFVKIDEDSLIFKINNGKIKLNIKTKIIINNIMSSEFKSSVKESLTSYFYIVSQDIENNLSRIKKI